jgi:hypothetical protein
MPTVTNAANDRRCYDCRCHHNRSRRYDYDWPSVRLTSSVRVQYRAWWWQQVTKKLDRLGNRVSADDRRKIEAALAKQVPPVTAEQMTALEQQKQKPLTWSNTAGISDSKAAGGM